MHAVPSSVRLFGPSTRIQLRPEPSRRVQPLRIGHPRPLRCAETHPNATLIYLSLSCNLSPRGRRNPSHHHHFLRSRPDTLRCSAGSTTKTRLHSSSIRKIGIHFFPYSQHTPRVLLIYRTPNPAFGHDHSCQMTKIIPKNLIR